MSGVGIGLAFLPILALIPALIARRKGQGFWTFYVAGLVLWIFALIWALVVKDRRPRCPDCREVVHADAVKCPHCQSDIAGRVTQEPATRLARPPATQ